MTSPLPLSAEDGGSDGRNDFDFYQGTWDVRVRQRKEALKNRDEWEESSGVTVARKILGGLGHMDEFSTETATGVEHILTVRLFDPRTRLWSISWASGSEGAWPAPGVGRFQHGSGDFYRHETLGDQSVFTRLRFTVSGPETFRWEQAYSADGGGSWETNTIGDFTRRASATE